jgi:hypothetical protein
MQEHPEACSDRSDKKVPIGDTPVAGYPLTPLLQLLTRQGSLANLSLANPRKVKVADLGQP